VTRRIWFRVDTPRNHFEMTDLLPKKTPEPVLYVTLNSGPTSVPKRFESAQVIGEQQFPTNALPVRQGRFYLLKGYEGDRAN